MSSRPAHCVLTEEIYDKVFICDESCLDPCVLHESFPIEKRDIMCSKCGGPLDDIEDSYNLFCPTCRIIWRV